MNKKLNFRNALTLTAVAAIGAAISAKAADTPQYERGVDGKDHAVLYRTTNGSGYTFDAQKWDYASEGSANNAAWIPDSIAVLAYNNVGWGNSMDVDVYAIRPVYSSFFFGTRNAGKLRLGAGGIEFVPSGASCTMTTRFKSSNMLHLTASQTWTVADGKSAIFRMNDLSNFDDSPFVLTAEDDITLSLSGNFTWEMNQSAAFQKVDVNVTSPAKIHLSATANANGVLQGGSLNARTLTNDGGYVQVKSMTGDPCRVAANVVLKNNATLAVNCDTSSTMAEGLAIDDVADSISASVGTGIVKGSIAPSETAFPVSAAAGATLSLRAAWRGAPSFAISGAGTIEFDGSGDAPNIASADGFTGTLVLKQSCTFAAGVLENFGGSIVYRVNATITGRYPTPVDFSHISVENGAKLTLNWYSPNAPVSYTSGMTVATGLGTGVTADDLTVSYRQEAGDKAYPASLGVDVNVVDGTISTMPQEPRPRLVYQGTYFDHASNYWKNESNETVGWTDGAIAVLSGLNGTIYNGTFSPYQLFMPTGKQGGFIRGNTSGANVYRLHLGAGGLDLYNNGPSLWNLLEFRLTSPQVWCHTNSDATVAFTIGNHEQSGRVPDLVTADPDCDLTVLGSLSVYLNAKGDFRHSGITLDGTKANNAAKLILDNVKSAASTATDITLNAKTLTIKGHSVLTVNSDDRVEGGWTIAKDLVLVSNANGTPEVAFGTDANNAVMGLDVATISSTGTGSAAKMTGTARIVSDALSVTIASGSSLNFGVGLVNAAEKSAAVTLHGGGELVAGCKNAAQALRLTSATVADFTGTVRVPNGGVLSLDGTVNLAGVTLENGAIVDMNAGAGATIADWSNVTFPASGTVTISLRSDVPYAAAMQSVAVPGDFSGVSSSDRAKIRIIVDDGQDNSPYSVVATPRFDGGTLYADLTASMVNGNTSNGRTVWLGEDFGDARVLSNWTKYESDATFDPSLHPDSVSVLDGTWLYYGLCSAMNWKIDLGGLELHVNDMRNNSDQTNPHYYAISNGTLHARTAMLYNGAFDIWKDGHLLADAYGKPSGIAGFWLRTYGKTYPFRLTIHDGGEMKATGEHQGFNFYNLACVVEEGGRLELSAKSVGVMTSNTDSSFVNYGTLSLPRGWVATNFYETAGEFAATCTVAQCGGRLEYAGAFDVAQRDGLYANVTYRLAVSGGTLAPSGDVSFAEWDLQIAPGADFGVEVRAGDTATLGDFNWGGDFTLTKTGAGAFELTVANSVDNGNVVVRGGYLVNGGDLNVGALAVTYAEDGCLAADPTATGAAADYGLLLTNATISAAAGTYNVRFVRSGAPEWINVLTVPESADPGLDAENVVFSTSVGRESEGEIRREAITVGGVSCVRYAVRRKPKGMMLIYR